MVYAQLCTILKSKKLKNLPQRRESIAFQVDRILLVTDNPHKNEKHFALPDGQVNERGKSI